MKSEKLLRPYDQGFVIDRSDMNLFLVVFPFHQIPLLVLADFEVVELLLEPLVLVIDDAHLPACLE